MAIDSSIALQAGRGVTQVDPMEAYAKVQNLMALKDQMAMRQMQMEQMKRENADREAMRGAFVFTPEGGLDEKQTFANIAKVSPESALKFRHQTAQEAAALSKGQREAQTAQVKLAKDAAERFGQIGGSILNAPQEQRAQLWQMGRMQAIQEGLPNADKLPEQYPGDQALHMMYMGAMDAAKQSDVTEKKTAPLTELGKLEQDFKMGRISEEDYIAAKKKATTHTPGVSLQLGGVERGIDPETGELVYFQPRKTGGKAEVIPNVRPEPKPGAGKGKTDPAKLDAIIAEARKLLPVAPGSGLGAAGAATAGFFGVSTEKTQAQAKLKALQASLMMNMPRMEGPQSDKDVQLYREQAGRIGDPTVPANDKLAALEVIGQINQRYADQVPQTPKTETAKTPTPGKVWTVRNDKDFESLPKGAHYKGPDGIERVK